MRCSLVAALALLAALSAPALAVERKPLKEVDFAEFSKDGQIQVGGDKEITFFWWIPVEFWEVAAAKDGPTAEGDVVKALRPYILLGVLRASVSQLGAFRYESRDQIRERLSVRYEKAGGRPIQLVPVDDVDPDVNIVLGQLRPILTNAIGNAGENMQFFTLTDSVDDGVTPISPYDSGAMYVEIAGRGELGRFQTSIDLPMNALFVPRLCPGGKPAHVSWKVCPWDGTALKP